MYFFIMYTQVFKVTLVYSQYSRSNVIIVKLITKKFVCAALTFVINNKIKMNYENVTSEEMLA